MTAVIVPLFENRRSAPSLYVLERVQEAEKILLCGLGDPKLAALVLAQARRHPSSHVRDAARRAQDRVATMRGNREGWRHEL